MRLDFSKLTEEFNSVAEDPTASPGDKFVAYTSAIRELEAALEVLRRDSDMLLNSAVRKLRDKFPLG